MEIEDVFLVVIFLFLMVCIMLIDVDSYSVMN